MFPGSSLSALACELLRRPGAANRLVNYDGSIDKDQLRAELDRLRFAADGARSVDWAVGHFPPAMTRSSGGWGRGRQPTPGRRSGTRRER